MISGGTRGLDSDPAEATVPDAVQDDALQEALQETERNACFSEHLAPHLGYVQRISRYLSSNRADAEDLAQETMLRAYRAADRFDGRHPKAWLYRIARNCAINRDVRKKDASFPEGHPGPTDHRTPDDMLLAGMLDPLLETALRNLPAHGRRVIELVDGQQLSYEEAAAVLDVPRGTIMSRVHRARKRLLAELEGTDLDRSARTKARPGPLTGHLTASGSLA